MRLWVTSFGRILKCARKKSATTSCYLPLPAHSGMIGKSSLWIWLRVSYQALTIRQNRSLSQRDTLQLVCTDRWRCSRALHTSKLDCSRVFWFQDVFRTRSMLFSTNFVKLFDLLSFLCQQDNLKAELTRLRRFFSYFSVRFQAAKKF